MGGLLPRAGTAGEVPASPRGRGGLEEEANIGELWAAQNPYSGWAASGRQPSFQFVLPRQQIRRDQIEARRVAGLFQHLEHLDDELPLAAGDAAAQAPRRRRCRGALLPGLVLAVAGALLPRMEPTSSHHPLFDFNATMFLLHTAAGLLMYAAVGPLLRLLSLLVLRFARVKGYWKTAQTVYLNGMLLREERVACSVYCLWAVNFSWWSSPTVTRELLSRPCQAVLLLILTNGLRKLLEFAFLTRRLRDRFQSDVLSNAFERAALQRLASLASECVRGQPEAAAILRNLPVLPDVGEPHAFERYTAQMLKTAFGLRDGFQKLPHVLIRKNSIGGSRAVTKESVSPSGSEAALRARSKTVEDLESSKPRGRKSSATGFKTPSTTVFVMQREETCAAIEEEARDLFWQLVSRPWSCTGLPPPDICDSSGQLIDSHWEVLEMASAGLLRSDLGQAMPPEDADRIWQVLGAKNRRETASVCEDEFMQAVRGTFERFHVLAATLKDNVAIWLVFSNLLTAVQVVVSIGAVMAVFVPWEVLRTICLSVPTAFLGFSFIFGSMLRELFESLVLILLVQPYDVGDRISLPDEEGACRVLTVQKINILTTEARDSANQCVYLKNSALFQEPRLMNLGRSLNAIVELNVEISTSQLSSEVVTELENFTRRYITHKAKNWVPTYLRSFTHIEDGCTHCDLSGSVTYCFRLMHRKPWQYIREIRSDATSILYALLEEMRRIGLDFRLTTRPVHIEGFGPAQGSPGGGSSSSPSGSRRPRAGGDAERSVGR